MPRQMYIFLSSSIDKDINYSITLFLFFYCVEATIILFQEIRGDFVLMAYIADGWHGGMLVYRY